MRDGHCFWLVLLCLLVDFGLNFIIITTVRVSIRLGLYLSCFGFYFPYVLHSVFVIRMCLCVCFGCSRESVCVCVCLWQKLCTFLLSVLLLTLYVSFLAYLRLCLRLRKFNLV